MHFATGTQADLMNPSGLFLTLAEACGLRKLRLFSREKGPVLVLVACRSEFVTADAAGGVRVLPLDGPSIGGVGVDIAAELAS